MYKLQQFFSLPALIAIALLAMGCAAGPNAGGNVRPQDNSPIYDLQDTGFPDSTRGVPENFRKVWRGVAIGDAGIYEGMLPYIVELDLRDIDASSIEGPFRKTTAPFRAVSMEAYRKEGESSFMSGYKGSIGLIIHPELGLIQFGRTNPIALGAHKTTGIPMMFQPCIAFMMGRPDRIASLAFTDRKELAGRVVFSPVSEFGSLLKLYDNWSLQVRTQEAVKHNSLPLTWSSVDLYRDWIAWSMENIRPSTSWNNQNEHGKFVLFPHAIGIANSELLNLDSQLQNQYKVGIGEMSLWRRSVVASFEGGSDAEMLARLKEHNKSRYEEALTELIKKAYQQRSASSLQNPFDPNVLGFFLRDIHPHYERTPTEKVRDQLLVDKAVEDLFPNDIAYLDARLAKLTNDIEGVYASNILLDNSRDRIGAFMQRAEAKNWLIKCRQRREAIYEAALPEMVALIGRTEVPGLENIRSHFFQSPESMGPMGNEVAKTAINVAIRQRLIDYQNALAKAPNCGRCAGKKEVEIIVPGIACLRCGDSGFACIACGGVANPDKKMNVKCSPCRGTGKTIPAGF